MRRMGGAKRYPSMPSTAIDGYRYAPPILRFALRLKTAAALRSGKARDLTISTWPPADWISLKRSRETKRWTSLWIRGAQRRVQHSSTAHQKEGPDRAWKTRTGDAQAAFPCHCSDVTAMREKS